MVAFPIGRTQVPDQNFDLPGAARAPMDQPGAKTVVCENAKSRNDRGSFDFGKIQESK